MGLHEMVEGAGPDAGIGGGSAVVLVLVVMDIFRVGL